VSPWWETPTDQAEAVSRAKGRAWKSQKFAVFAGSS